MSMTSEQPRLILPGLLPADPSLERYWVRPGGVTVFMLAPDDRMTLIDVDGAQPAEITVIGADGSDDAGALGMKSDAPATAINSFHVPGMDPARVRAVRVFGEYSPPGAAEVFRAERSVTVAVAAPGNGAVIDGALPPSNLLIEIHKAVPRIPQEPQVPEPLADPRVDFRIDRATAQSYEVRAGEYIQVIDVEGKQCSDFLAFHRRKLESGLERGFDPTITRTLMGNAFPQPGLYSKFYDLDMDPLVEVVRDTVGRHDSFLLACTSKYYADMGYPGHVNCTDNFNAALDRFAIVRRQGWQALNFFYNTMFGTDNLLVFDEPWSRAGDYVLLRAMTDLVCASSACPDDIDPANGWDPTEIHIRVYSPEHKFSAAIAHRVTADAEPTLTKKTGFHERIEALTGRMTEYRGYWLPAAFNNDGAIAEYWACREAAVVMDLSPLRKFEVLGPDAEELMQMVVTRDVRKLSVGQVTYTAICNEAGGMIDDGTLFRLGPDQMRWVGGDEYDGVWLKEQAARLGLKVVVKDSTDHLHNLAVQGPKSREVLKDIVWTAPTQTPLTDLRWFRFAVGRVGGPQGIPVVISRTGYSGELGYEVFCQPKDAAALWDAIWEAGQPYGLKPLGLEALDILRIESGLIFYGAEFDDQVDPFEAGIGFTVDLADDIDFIGRSALVERHAHPQRTLVGLELAGNETAHHGDPVYRGRSRVGVVTSGTRSPVLQKNIALCRIAVQYQDLGTEVEIGKLDGFQKRIPAVVAQFPFYDPEKRRPRA
jgi:glycine cleavage system T protein (aminomethyltransferase)